VDGKSDALVSDRSVLLDLAKHGSGAGEVTVLDREFDRRPTPFPFRRDQDFGCSSIAC
jgi:hypothetical protein